jgi:hypothetical protein
MPVVVQIHQLIAPLRQDAQRIFQESDDDQEAADGGQVRLDGFAERVQPVLDLARLLADGIEGRGVVGRVAARRTRAGVEACVLAGEVVPCGTADRHAGRFVMWMLYWWKRGVGCSAAARACVS